MAINNNHSLNQWDLRSFSALTPSLSLAGQSTDHLKKLYNSSNIQHDDSTIQIVDILTDGCSLSLRGEVRVDKTK